MKMTTERAQEELKNYKCFFCGNPADRIGFFAKLYQHSGKSTKENPTLFCQSCWNDPLRREQINNVRGGIEGVFCHLFCDLGKMTESEIGKITSRVRYEMNHLASRIWRKQVYQIHYLSIPPKSNKTDEDKGDNVYETDRNDLQGFPVQEQVRSKMGGFL